MTATAKSAPDLLTKSDFDEFRVEISACIEKAKFQVITAIACAMVICMAIQIGVVTHLPKRLISATIITMEADNLAIPNPPYP